MRRVEEVAREDARDGAEVQNGFAARLVHEIRNPLAPIRMALHIMQMSDSDAGTLQAARVLVADDNRDAAHTLAMMLDLEGHDVRTAHDGLGTLAIGQLFKPELVLLDIAMPVLNGYQTARQIRDRPWGQGAYLAALTAWGHDSDRRTALENGFEDHIVEPAALDRLRSVVNVARDVTDREGP